MTLAQRQIGIYKGVNRMNKKTITANDIIITSIQSEDVLMNDVQSALDLLSSVFFNDNCQHIILNKEAIIEEFFRLSSGIAGEVLQKVVNFRMKLAIIGDFSGYTSKPLKDFIYECNNGNDIFFVADEKQAIEKLTKNSML